MPAYNENFRYLKNIYRKICDYFGLVELLIYNCANEEAVTINAKAYKQIIQNLF